MRVFVVSDIHTDYPDNLSWVDRLCAARTTPCDDDALIVAGDVADDPTVFRKTFERLTAAYKWVFFVAGNHELWVRRAERGSYDSIGKLAFLRSICDELGVHHRPTRLPTGVWVVPLWSWYHASFDREPDVHGATPIEKIMMDFHACSWSSVPGLNASGDDSLARYFDDINDPDFETALKAIEEERKNAVGGGGRRCPAVISFSHFLPLQDLLPEKRWLHFPNLAKACGSDYLARRIEKLRPDCHVYGHTHFTGDQTIDGVRYIQWPLGYPRERSRRRNGGEGWAPLAVWDVSMGGATPEKEAYWSAYYKNNERRPEVVTPAPWAA